jgi:diaminopimelate decarboxylase
VGAEGCLHLRDGALHVEGVALADLATRFGTPTYVYSKAALAQAYGAFTNAFSAASDSLACYAVKANSTLAVLGVLAGAGAGFDIVSGGELQRVIRAGGSASRVVFSGVSKSHEDIAAALEAGILCFNVESAAELERIAGIAAQRGQIASVSLRVNPDVDAMSHPYISTGLRENKFGVDMETARALYHRAASLPSLRVCGIDCHIGSQITSLSPFVDALDRVLGLVDALAAETPPSVQDYAAAIVAGVGTRRLRLLTEPGRAIVASAGLLLTRVEYLKQNGERHFAIVDAGMNDLLRPALYGAWMGIEAVRPRAGATQDWDIVGPVCESADFLGKQRALRLEAGDLLAVRDAGAYAFSMSSNYNSRCRAAEVMVDGDTAFLVRERERFEDLVRGERLLPAGV